MKPVARAPLLTFEIETADRAGRPVNRNALGASFCVPLVCIDLDPPNDTFSILESVRYLLRQRNVRHPVLQIILRRVAPYVHKPKPGDLKLIPGEQLPPWFRENQILDAQL